MTANLRRMNARGMCTHGHFDLPQNVLRRRTDFVRRQRDKHGRNVLVKVTQGQVPEESGKFSSIRRCGAFAIPEQIAVALLRSFLITQFRSDQRRDGVLIRHLEER